MAVNVRVYRRHAGGPASLTSFLFVWSSGWIVGMGSPFITGRTRLNGREVEIGDTWHFFGFMVFVGAIVFGVASMLWLRRRNDRVELTGTELRWFDWTGRLKGRADLLEVKAVRDGDSLMGGSGSHTVVETSHSSFRFGKVGTAGYFDLRERLRLAMAGKLYDASQILPPPQQAEKPLQPYVYRYRFSGLHAISIFPLVVGVFAFSGGRHSPTVAGQILGPILVALGLWGQLIGWNERIEVGETGLRWFDLLGRLKAEILANEVLGIAGTHVSGGLYRIEGTQAIIRFSLHLVKAQMLREQIEHLAPYL